MRRHALLALATAGVLALTACDADDPDAGTDLPADQPADDAADGTDTDAGADGDDLAAGSEVDPAAIEDGEVLPGIRLEVPDEAVVTTAELPNGRSYIGALDDDEVAVFVEVTPSGPDVATRTADVEGVEASGQGTVEEPTTTVDVEGADEAARVAVSDALGRVRATMVAVTAGSNAVTVVVEAPLDTEVDVDAILATLAIDPARLDA